MAMYNKKEKVRNRMDRKNLETFIKLKPNDIKVSDLKWKYLMTNLMRGRNTMLVGDSGSGKTQIVMSLYETLNEMDSDWTYEKFDLGSSQDARSMLMGNMYLKGDTIFKKSRFAQAIAKEKTVIHLDEITRAHMDAWNILMPVLDPISRTFYLDDDINAPRIKVADNVVFFATANIGSEYTATSVLDAALRDRFTIVEMNLLGLEDEVDLLKIKCPNADTSDVETLTKIAVKTREADSMELGNVISTRINIEACSLLEDGFTVEEIIGLVFFPMFDSEGEHDSERTKFRQILQTIPEISNSEIPE